MMPLKTLLTGLSPPRINIEPSDVEMRPCGLMVQKRVEEDPNATPFPVIRVRVKYESVYHEISITSQASFGELKKKLTDPTGLHYEDQKLFFKGKERDSKDFLDVSGVKDKSKIVLVEDSISQEKRWLEMRRIAKIEYAAKSISNISFDVDRLAAKVSAIESVISKGEKVSEKDVLILIELLMNELIKLDAIVVDGDLKSHHKIQVRRVQKFVEKLDMIKIKSTTPMSRFSPIPSKSRPESPKMVLRKPPSSKTVVTTKWETFDLMPSLNTSSSPPPLIQLSLIKTTRPPVSNRNKLILDLLR